tara:strand:- start:383 stop:547 length:165 start_codon:yes stop_codon:yes gene_type:complete
MKAFNKKLDAKKSCQLPRKQKAIEALLLLSWKIAKKDRPTWLRRDLAAYSQRTF